MCVGHGTGENTQTVLQGRICRLCCRGEYADCAAGEIMQTAVAEESGLKHGDAGWSIYIHGTGS